MNKRKVIIAIILIICLIGCFIRMKKNKDDKQNIDNLIDNNVIIEQQEQEKIEEEIIATVEQQEQEEITPETYTVMYTTVKLHIRAAADINSEIIDTTNINEELMTIDGSDDGEWTKIKLNDNYYFVASKFLSNEKVEIKIEKPEQKISNRNSNNNRSNNNVGVLTKSKGVNYFNGHRETWYSQRVLPGGGLKIPGRHVDERGLICDENGYICVASSDYSWGTIVETSLGTGRVYDSRMS